MLHLHGSYVIIDEEQIIMQYTDNDCDLYYTNVQKMGSEKWKMGWFVGKIGQNRKKTVNGKWLNGK